MRLTPQQIQEIAGVSRDVLRHWRKTLSPLQGKNGYRPCFSLGDALAIKVIQHLTRDFGVAVSALGDVAPMLFAVCQKKTWAIQRDSWLVLNLPANTVVCLESLAELDTRAAVLLIPLGRLMGELQSVMLGNEETAEQVQLEFPPTPGEVAGRRARKPATGRGS